MTPSTERKPFYTEIGRGRPFRSTFAKKLQQGKIPFMKGYGRFKSGMMDRFREEQKLLSKKNRSVKTVGQLVKEFFQPKARSATK